MKGWDVGLLCVRCGKPVRRKTGFYCQPILYGKRAGNPWARHVGTCPK